jgi:hypothetical protein
MADMVDADADQLPHFLVAACPHPACPRPAAELDYAARLAAHASGALLHVEDVRGGVVCIQRDAYDVVIHRPTPDQARWIACLLRRLPLPARPSGDGGSGRDSAQDRDRDGGSYDRTTTHHPRPR